MRIEPGERRLTLLKKEKMLWTCIYPSICDWCLTTSGGTNDALLVSICDSFVENEVISVNRNNVSPGGDSK